MPPTKIEPNVCQGAIHDCLDEKQRKILTSEGILFEEPLFVKRRATQRQQPLTRPRSDLEGLGFVPLVGFKASIKPPVSPLHRAGTYGTIRVLLDVPPNVIMRDFTQHHWQPLTQRDFEQLLTLALFEDADTTGDLTCLALVPQAAQGSAAVVARTEGILAGVPLMPLILSAVDSDLVWEPVLDDSAKLTGGTIVGIIRGPARGLLAAERLVLNFLGRLSGIATLTKWHVDAVRGTKCNIYDTRKTTPGWRRLEKYAVACGGGKNHRTGLYDAVLIKDNHLALGRQESKPFSPAEAVMRAKEFLRQRLAALPIVDSPPIVDNPIVEIEVDTLDQLREVLPAEPDIVLLDNMIPPQITEAIQIRNSVKPSVQLEASGGITKETLRAIAETGVERISIGALTHSAVSLDFGLDWESQK